MSDQPKESQEEPQNALLGDLESIRDLFDEEQKEEQEDAQAEAAAQVPVLDDVVDIPEDQLPDSQHQPTSPAPELSDDLFQALLGDEWRTSTALVLQQARDKIEDNSPHWAPEDTDDLNAALKVRIDETMQGWMRSMVIEHMADLHEQLLAVLSAELPGMIDDIIVAGQHRRPKDADGQ